MFDEDEVVARAREAQAAMIQEAGYSDRIGLSAFWPVIEPETQERDLP